jgi:hypothetical protein
MSEESNRSLRKHYIPTLVIGLLIGIASACGGKGQEEQTDGLDSQKKRITYRRSDYGDRWPFSVDEITVFCVMGNRVYFESSGMVYPLNGKAMADSKRDFKEIWLDNPNLSGTKIPPPGEFISNALNNCK